MGIVDDMRRRFEEEGESAREFDTATLTLMSDLRYPVSKDGSIVDLIYFSPLIAYHLARCGWRIDPSKRQIKPRPIVAKGVQEGAIEWVDVDEPDDPLANLHSMTIAEIDSLPPHLRAEALRRLGAPETPDLPDNPGWHVSTTLNVADAPDPNDGYEWSGRKGDVK